MPYKVDDKHIYQIRTTNTTSLNSPSAKTLGDILHMYIVLVVYNKLVNDLWSIQCIRLHIWNTAIKTHLYKQQTKHEHSHFYK